MPFIGNGFNYEAEHFGNLIKEERTESDIMPLWQKVFRLQRPWIK